MNSRLPGPTAAQRTRTGDTLGGNATLIGASANVAAVGICARRGERVSFGQFMRYGVPITVAQLAVGALYVLALTALLR